MCKTDRYIPPKDLQLSLQQNVCLQSLNSWGPNNLACPTSVFLFFFLSLKLMNFVPLAIYVPLGVDSPHTHKKNLENVIFLCWYEKWQKSKSSTGPNTFTSHHNSHAFLRDFVWLHPNLKHPITRQMNCAKLQNVQVFVIMCGQTVMAKFNDSQ